MTGVQRAERGATREDGVAAAARAALAAFDPASADLLAERALQRRADRKYLLSVRQLVPLLSALQPRFRLLQAGARPAARYTSLYFDTPELTMFHEHRRGRRPRYKVRVRHHLDRHKTFLEVKRKGADERTVKQRLERPFGHETLDDEDRRFLEQHAPRRGALHPVAQTHFLRATLLCVDSEERVTIDWALAFEGPAGQRDLPSVVVAEIKQARLRHTTPAVRAFRGLGLRELSSSKYCLAVAQLGLSPRTQRFAPALKAIRRLT